MPKNPADSRRCLGLVTARSGSKGLPGKNVRLTAGKPLIAWTLEAARAAKSIDRTIVSTDDETIAETARQWGGDVPFLRPTELAQDASPHIDVVLHALNWLDEHQDYRPDYLVLLQPTSPLRSAGDIDGAVALARTRNAGAVVSVCETHDHPYLVRRMTDHGTLEEFLPCPISYARRQDLPPAYALNGAIYVVRRDVLLASRTLCPPETYAYLMRPERSLQIDSVLDLQLVEYLLKGSSDG